MTLSKYLSCFTIPADKREYVVIDNRNEQPQIELNHFAKMWVLTPDAKFKKVSFYPNVCSELSINFMKSLTVT